MSERVVRMITGGKTGEKAVEFCLEDLQGNEHHLEDYRGRWLLLVFHRHLG